MAMNIILIGPPGVGKGTQANFITNRYALQYITTGNLLRKEVELSTSLGNKIASIISTGDLVPNDIVDTLIKNEVSLSKQEGILFDGYPRNLEQVHVLQEVLQGLDKSLDLVINMSLEDELLIKRISGRFVCSNCGAVYNKYYVIPSVVGVCDHCQGNNFVTRSDDSEEIIKKRLSIFHNENEAIVNYYRDLGVLIDINCAGSVNDISDKVSNVIDSLKVKV